MLTGIAAVYFQAIPRLSLLASLAGTIPFCLAIIGTMLGFAWLCEKFDDLRVTSLDEPIERVKEPKAAEAQQFVEGGSAYRTRRRLASARHRPLPTASRPTSTKGLFRRTGWTSVGTVTVTANGWRGQ
jgi:hypothetical protein